MTQEASPQIIYWALVGRRGEEAATVVVRGERDWQRQLEVDLSDMRSDRVVVAIEHVILRIFVDLLRRRATRTSAPIRRSIVNRVIEERGWVVEAAYRIWPSVDRPRVALPNSNLSLAAWMQRTGVLGGGRAISIRAAVRSRLTTPLILRTARATALVLRRRTSEWPAR